MGASWADRYKHPCTGRCGRMLPAGLLLCAGCRDARQAERAGTADAAREIRLERRARREQELLDARD